MPGLRRSRTHVRAWSGSACARRCTWTRPPTLRSHLRWHPVAFSSSRQGAALLERRPVHWEAGMLHCAAGAWVHTGHLTALQRCTACRGQLRRLAAQVPLKQVEATERLLQPAGAAPGALAQRWPRPGPGRSRPEQAASAHCDLDEEPQITCTVPGVSGRSGRLAPPTQEKVRGWCSKRLAPQCYASSPGCACICQARYCFVERPCQTVMVAVRWLDACCAQENAPLRSVRQPASWHSRPPAKRRKSGTDGQRRMTNFFRPSL